MAKKRWMVVALVSVVTVLSGTVATQRQFPPGYVDPAPILAAARAAIGTDHLRCLTISGTAYGGALGQARESARNTDWPRIDSLANYTRTMNWDTWTMKEEFDRKPGLTPAGWKYGIGWEDGPLQKNAHQVFLLNGKYGWYMDGAGTPPVRDGRHLLFSATTSSDYDLWLVPLAGDAKPVRFLSAPGDQWHGNFSPDGKLVAYTSSESGPFEVHVQTFPLTDRHSTVSTTGGYEPRWRADGREMYYLSLDQKLMAVPVGPGPSFGAPTALFQARMAGGVNANRTHYVPSRDGQRFLINTPTGDTAMVPITVVLNWTAALKK